MRNIGSERKRERTRGQTEEERVREGRWGEGGERWREKDETREMKREMD